MSAFSKLTRAELKRLPVGASASEHGITFTRLPNGDGRWSVNVMVNRVRHHQVVGTEREGFTRTQAEELIAQLKAKKREGDHGITAPKHRARFTVRAAAANYLEFLRGHGGKDIERKAKRFELHVCRLLGDKPVDKLTDEDWKAYVTTRRAEGASDATINREAAALAHMLRTAVKRRQLRTMPILIERLREPPGRLVYLSPVQLRELIDAAAIDQSPHSLTFVMIAGHTGMRQEPILNLKVRDIDVERRVIWVGKDKAGRREQPMPRNLADYLRPLIARGQPDDWLFPAGRSKRGRVYQINSQFARCVERAGLPSNITPHTMRHTVATNAAHAGLDAATIQAIGGWKTRAMAERYTHAANLVDAMDALQGQLAGGVSPKLHRRRAQVA